MTVVNPKQTTRYDLNASESTLTFGGKTNIDVTTSGVAGVYGSTAADWNVTNLGSIAGSSAVVFEGGGTFVNGASGKISDPTGINFGVHIKGSGSITNAGSIIHSYTSGGTTGAVALDGSGTIVNKASGTIVGNVSLGGTGAVTNKGSITNSGTHFSDISINGGGTATNSGVINLSGASSAHCSGIYLVAGGGATNTGKIIGSATYMSGMFSESGGTITNSGVIRLASAQHIAGIQLKAGGSVDNTGKIKVTVSVAHAAGIELDAGGTVTNSGTILLSSPSHGSGVDLANGGTLVNTTSGYISAVDRAGVYAGGSTGATITNAGIITSGTSGGDSIELANVGTSSAAITNTLTLQSGSDLIGKAVGSTGAFVSNDLVFDGAGTASNAFANFQLLTVDSAANWKISGAAGIADTVVEGKLRVTGSGSLSGALTIEGGTAIFKSNYDGNVTFAGAGEFGLTDAYTGVISGLATSDKIDLLGLTFTHGAAASVSGNILTVGTASNHVTLTLDSSSYSSTNFAVSKDAGGHVLVTYT